MADPTRESKPTIEAGPVRRALHTLLALAGWVLFIYWWWLVFRRVSDREIRFTATFIAVALIAIVSLTMIWAIHNVRIFRKKGPRLHQRAPEPEPTHDSVGRAVKMPAIPETCRSAAVVSVRIQNGDKVYVPGDYGPPLGPSGRRAP